MSSAAKHRRDAPARLVHAQQLGDDVFQGGVTVVAVAERDLGHRVVQHPRRHRMPFRVIGVEVVTISAGNAPSVSRLGDGQRVSYIPTPSLTLTTAPASRINTDQQMTVRPAAPPAAGASTTGCCGPGPSTSAPTRVG